MQSVRSSTNRHPNSSWLKNGVAERLSCMGPSLRRPSKGFGTRVLEGLRALPGQKDMTSELLERAFSLALSTRLKQHSGIHVDVRSTAWGLMEGKFGGMTVRGFKWRTPLELTADQLMVDVGELVLDYQKLMWQQMVALKNVPQGSVAFTLTSQDLANFMVHPLMVTAAARAVMGQAFIFDRSTASVRLDPATGRGVITYQGTWAGDGHRYAVSMTTPPAGTAAAKAAKAAPAAGRPGVASVVASSNTLEQLTVSARRMRPGGAAAAASTSTSAAAAARSTTGSFASLGSTDESPLVAAAAAASAAAAAAAASAANGARVAGRTRTLTVAPPAPTPAAVAAATATAAAGGGAAALAALSTASAGSTEYDNALEEDPGAEMVAEGLRRFFSNLVINLQGIELRNPVLLVQLPGPGVGAASGGTGVQRAPAAATAPPAAAPRPVGPLGAQPPAPAAAPAPPPAGSETASLAPALLTITMRVAILQLPPLDMKF